MIYMRGLMAATTIAATVGGGGGRGVGQGAGRRARGLPHAVVVGAHTAGFVPPGGFGAVAVGAS